MVPAQGCVTALPKVALIFIYLYPHPLYGFLNNFYWKQINKVTNFLLPSHVLGPKLMVWMIHTISSTNFLTGSWNFKC